MPGPVMTPYAGPLVPQGVTTFMQGHPILRDIVNDISLAPMSANVNSGEVNGPIKQALQRVLGRHTATLGVHAAGDITSGLKDYATDPNNLVPIGVDMAKGLLTPEGGEAAAGLAAPTFADVIRRALGSR